MLVGRNGVSMIAAGLDHWFKREDGNPADAREFIVNEWRLSRQLGTGQFRLPPDFREPGPDVPNAAMTVPFLRFPLAHVCPKCGWMIMATLTQRTSPRCKFDNRIMGQAPLVTICEAGHIQDFPWREWAHRDAHPECQEDLFFKSAGSATLAGQKVRCSCGKERSLSGVTFDNVLTKSLDESQEYLCQGKQPWLGHMDSASCSHRVVVVLRSATNVYFARTQSAIFIPRGGNEAPKKLIDILESPAVSQFVRMLGEALDPQELKSGAIPEIAELLADYENDEVRSAIRFIVNENKPENRKPKASVDFRREEFAVLRRKRDEEQLKIRVPDLNVYDANVQQLFGRITLVEKLRETRALYGFTRVVSESDVDLKDMKSRLRRSDSEQDWLPAHVVYGEGIFLEFDEARFRAWENEYAAQLAARTDPLTRRMDQHLKAIRAQDRPVNTRSLLVHTFAHVLINQLVFECGYSAASLQERLYTSDDGKDSMAAVLIYTASGDTEGTMGGLVRMGQAGLLEPVIRKAIENAAWCSADPVCMEIGSTSGQGPGGLNLAACHGCALLPETSCEMFNQGLDRAMLVGDVATGGSLEGYFKSFLP